MLDPHNFHRLLLPFIFLAVPKVASIEPVDRSNSVFAETIYGPIEGFRHTSRDGTQSHVFLGVPFAKPPINELRFEVNQFAPSPSYIVFVVFSASVASLEMEYNPKLQNLPSFVHSHVVATDSE